MKKLTCFFLAALMMPVGAIAQDDGATEPVKVQFIPMGELGITGQNVKPQLKWMDARSRAKFERLLELKKNFLPEIEQTGRDISLR